LCFRCQGSSGTGTLFSGTTFRNGYYKMFHFHQDCMHRLVHALDIAARLSLQKGRVSRMCCQYVLTPACISGDEAFLVSSGTSCIPEQKNHLEVACIRFKHQTWISEIVTFVRKHPLPIARTKLSVMKVLGLLGSTPSRRVTRAHCLEAPATDCRTPASTSVPCGLEDVRGIGFAELYPDD